MLFFGCFYWFELNKTNDLISFIVIPSNKLYIDKSNCYLMGHRIRITEFANAFQIKIYSNFFSNKIRINLTKALNQNTIFQCFSWYTQFYFPPIQNKYFAFCGKTNISFVSLRANHLLSWLRSSTHSHTTHRYQK